MYGNVQEIENIYFFEMNTKYISLNVMKTLVNSPVCTLNGISDIFNISNEIFLVFTKTNKFSYYFTSHKQHQNQLFF